MEIVWVSESRINWPKYLEFCKTSNNGYPTRTLDNSSLKFNEPLTYALTLNELTGRTEEPMRTIRNGHLFLEAINISILVDEINKGWYASISKIDLSNQLYLLYGTLRKWKDTIRTNLIFKEDEEQVRRTLFGTLLLEFEAHGYGLIWDSYAKTMLPDGTFILEEK